MGRVRSHENSATGRQHACWGYGDEEDFWHRVGDFVQEGVEAGERVVTMAAGRAVSPPARDAQPRQVIRMRVEGFQRNGGVPGRTSRLRRMVGEALNDGFAGLRLIADATPIATSAQLRELVPWELGLGRLASEYSMRVVCALQSSEVDKELSADLASFHDVVEGAVPLPLATISLTSHGLSVEGELDSTNGDLFEAALAETTGDVTIDMSGVDFMDVGSMRVLRRFVMETENTGRSVTLSSIPDSVTRCWPLLEGVS